LAEFHEKLLARRNAYFQQPSSIVVPLFRQKSETELLVCTTKCTLASLSRCMTPQHLHRLHDLLKRLVLGALMRGWTGQATIGIDFGVTSMDALGERVKVNFFDMSGHHSFKEVREDFYANTQGLIVTFDVTSKDSFANLEGWLDEMRQNLEGADAVIGSVAVLICATKTDKAGRMVAEGTSRLWAESRGYRYMETSAQSGRNVDEMFQAVFDAVIETQRNGGLVVAPDRPLFGQAQLDAISTMSNAGVFLRSCLCLIIQMSFVYPRPCAHVCSCVPERA
jgi:small GTP-binding protein